MRKYLWLGAILSVAAALGVYWTAQFAAQHPESFASNCLSAARLGLYLSSPALPQVAVHQVSGGTTTVCNGVACAHRADGAPQERLPRAKRVPKPTTPLKVEDPEEVIHIEQVDPKIAKIIAEALEVPDILKRVEAIAPADKGPDEVVLTILDGNDPAQFLDPAVQVHRPVTRPCTADVGCRPAPEMPYCADSEEELAAIQSGSRWQQVRHTSPRSHAKRIAVVPYVEEPTDLVMPYIDEETESSEPQEANQTDPSDVQDPSNMTEAGDEYAPGTEQSGHMDPYHHHEHEGCPYYNGNYCPRYSHPYSPPPATEQPETQAAPMEFPQEETEQPTQPGS